MFNEVSAQTAASVPRPKEPATSGRPDPGQAARPAEEAPRPAGPQGVSPAQAGQEAEGRKVEAGRPAARAGPAPRPAQGAVQAAGQEGLSRAVEQLNDFIQTVQRELQFNVDEDTGQTVVKVVEAKSGDVIRQIPPEEVLALLGRLQELKETMSPEDAAAAEEAARGFFVKARA